MMFVRYFFPALVVSALCAAGVARGCPPVPVAPIPVAPVPVGPNPVAPLPWAPLPAPTPVPLPAAATAFAPALPGFMAVCAPVASYAVVAAPCAPAVVSVPVAVAAPAVVSTVALPLLARCKPRLRDRLAALVACKSTTAGNPCATGGKLVIKQKVVQQF